MSVSAGQESKGEQTQGRWDPLINELHKLREAAGTPSYETLTRKLTEQRIENGQDEHAARIARSSVHDAFRFGRSRINEALVLELVRVMDGDPTAVEMWVAVCSSPPRSAWTPPTAVEHPDQPEAQPVPVVAVTTTQQLLLALACIALNLLGREFVDFLHLPLYFDMVGTAIVAIALGPWRGASVGLATNVLGVIGSGWVSLPLAVVNVAGALVWGYGTRRFGMGRTLPRFFGLNVLAALVCSLLAVPILLALYGHSFRDGHDLITQIIEESVARPVLAVSLSNVLTSLADKLISGFVALVAISALPLALRRGVGLVAVTEDSSQAG